MVLSPYMCMHPRTGKNRRQTDEQDGPQTSAHITTVGVGISAFARE